MIRSKKDLKEYIAADNHFLHSKGIKSAVIADYACYPHRLISRYLYFLRKQEYYINTAGNNKFMKMRALYYERQKNRLGLKLGIEIDANCCGKGLSIWHAGNIVINSRAVIGEYCTFHGGNCVGNNGKSQAVPHIGNHVDIGFGAVVIGGVHIADGCTIGANAVVNRSFEKKGSVIVGIPAHIVDRTVY